MNAIQIPYPAPSLAALVETPAPPAPPAAVKRYTPLTKALTRFMNTKGEWLLYRAPDGMARSVKGRVTQVDAHGDSRIVEGTGESYRMRICVISPEHWDLAGLVLRPERNGQITDSERTYRVADVEVARDEGTDGRYELKLEG